MTRPYAAVPVLALILSLAPLVALAVVEPKTKTEYPDRIQVAEGEQEATLVATGVSLREKTLAKVDVYTIVSYVREGEDLGEDPGRTLRTIDAPKRIRMDLRRGFGRDKLLDSFRGTIDRNYDDQSAFAADLATFLAYFDRDAQAGDVIVFDYWPGRGLVTSLNEEIKGTITNTAFVEALWTVWFGERPATDGLKRDLLAGI